MGGSSWSDDFYSARAKVRSSTGASAFSYTDTLRSSRLRSSWECHESLDPKSVIRESRDSDDHPNSNAIGVLFDVTGSMGDIPVELQKKLPSLLTMLLRKGYIDDPQILFGAIGDATCDRVPLQVGQFESGNEMEDHLENIMIEQGGGGGSRESYELGMYFFANKTKIDCLEKRGDKGYLFTIGDEMPYRLIDKDQVKTIFGDTIQADIPIKDVIAKVKEQYHYFHILPSQAYNNGNSEIKNAWIELLDQNLLHLDDPDAVCETIALAIGIQEDVVDIKSGVDDLIDVGSSSSLTTSASKAVATIVSSRGSMSTMVNIPETEGGSSERL